MSPFICPIEGNSSLPVGPIFHVRSPDFKCTTRVFQYAVKPKSVSSLKSNENWLFSMVRASGHCNSICAVPTTSPPYTSSTIAVPAVPSSATNCAAIPPSVSEEISVISPLTALSDETRQYAPSGIPMPKPAVSAPIALNSTVAPGVYTSFCGDTIAEPNTPVGSELDTTKRDDDTERS